MTDQERMEQERFELERIEKQFARCKYPVVYEEIRTEEIMLKMTDGVLLRTILLRPEVEGQVPVIVVRTCYPNNDYIYRATAMEYCKRGLAYIYQYCRGTGGSEGEWVPNENERADGKCMIDWICGLAWAGNVGYFGCSYLALTGWLIADILPEKVKTMYLTHYGTFRHVSAYKDGAFRHDVLTAWAMENAGYPVNADYLASCRFQPHVEVDEKLWGKRLDWYRKWVTGTNESDAYWNTGLWGLLKEIPSRVKVPVYIGEGWYDHHLGSAIETYRRLSDECKKKSRFLIGAWDHNFNVAVKGHQGEHFENDDVLRAFYWFYQLLVEEKEPQGSVDTYIIGDDSWFCRADYDIEEQEEFKVWLGKGRTLTDRPQEEGTVEFTFCPENPVPSHGAESLLATGWEQGSLLQPGPDYREDVVSFCSRPLKESITVLGKIRVNLDVGTDAEDTAFVVKVMEVMEDGKAYNIRTGITTLGYRGGSKKRQTYTPHTIVPISIEMWDVAWKIQKNSRLRIDITSSDFPQYCVHSNYAGCWAQARQNKDACQKIYFGKGHSSSVVFPKLETDGSRVGD